jgi:guanosine-3',5'-bis(diphosphate) 3'-pyrophosphohydrolase
MDAQTLYQEALKFAAAKHMEKGQTVPGTDLPYVVHLSNVAMETVIASAYSGGFDLGFAVQVALLHDTMEDTSTGFGELEHRFGVEIAKAVSSLTKNKGLPQELRMLDSLTRIKKLPAEVWAVKLADRITNLQAPPPDWDKEKRIKYQKEARIILGELKDGNVFLARRLEAKIEEYGNYIQGWSHQQEQA